MWQFNIIESNAFCVCPLLAVWSWKSNKNFLSSDKIYDDGCFWIIMTAMVIHLSLRPSILTMELLPFIFFSPFSIFKAWLFHMFIKPSYTCFEINCSFVIFSLFPHIYFMLILMANNLHQSKEVSLCCSDKHHEYLSGSVIPCTHQGLDATLLYIEGAA